MRYQIEHFPKISVVTPSFNQAEYLAETLASIVNQRYPNLELIVMDGGSTDGSRDVIRSFEPHIAYWVSEKDRGQSHAINMGLAKATGDVLCWLNSDDVFLPGALNAVAYTFNSHSDWDWISGPCLKFGDRFHELVGYFEQPADAAEWMVHCPISQPSTFWRRKLYEKHGDLDESFNFALDFEYWIRFVTAGETLHFIDRPLSAYRLHDVSKTVAHAEKFKAEELRLRAKHIDKLSAAQRSKLDALLHRSSAMDALSEAVMKVADSPTDARAEVVGVLKKDLRLLFTRTGAASLYRVLARKPRYRE
jgi:glycosyltransferase involved in cell wall biosynthesis